MANTSVDGLISGLQTSTIISQLMQLEAQPQNRLKTKVSTETSVVTAYQSINAALKTAIDNAKALDSNLDWRVFTASSSSTSVAATAGSSASAGSYSFDVVSVAKPHTELYGTAAAKTDVVASGNLDITQGGTTTPVPVGGGTLQEVVDGINNSSTLGVRAGVIKVADGSYRLQLTSKASGEASQFTVSGLNGAVGAPTVTSTGTDAAIQIGPDAVNDVVRSSTNTFTDVFPGVTFTVTKPETAVTVTVGTDNTSLAGKVKSLVDSLNAALAEMSKDTAYDPATKKGGPLLGQLLPSRVQGALRNAVIDGKTGTLAAAGIQLDSTGKIVLDETKLADALKADAGSVTTLVSGFAQRVMAVAEPVGGSTGEISKVISGRQSLIATLNDQIENWDTRLALRQSSLQRQYAALETALGNLQSQGSWLSSQISSLPSSSS